MINRSSRYYGGYTGRVVDSQNQPYTKYVYRRFNVSSDTTYVLYIIVEGDRLDTLAQMVYGNPQYWHRILDINPEIPDAWNLVPGTVIRIPENA